MEISVRRKSGNPAPSTYCGNRRYDILLASKEKMKHIKQDFCDLPIFHVFAANVNRRKNRIQIIFTHILQGLFCKFIGNISHSVPNALKTFFKEGS